MNLIFKERKDSVPYFTPSQESEQKIFYRTGCDGTYLQTQHLGAEAERSYNILIACLGFLVSLVSTWLHSETLSQNRHLKRVADMA